MIKKELLKTNNPKTENKEKGWRPSRLQMANFRKAIKLNSRIITEVYQTRAKSIGGLTLIQKYYTIVQDTYIRVRHYAFKKI